MRFFPLRKSKQQAPPDHGPIGLLAGWGDYPLVVAEELRHQGYRVDVIGIREHADPRLAELCANFEWIGLGSIGRAIRYFKAWGVREVVMSGKVHKILFYRPGWWVKHRPDWKCIKAFYPQLLLGTSDRKDDTLLSTVVEAFASEGLTMKPATEFLPQLLAPSGHLAGSPLRSKQQRDAHFGWEVAKAMGGLDVGQTVCVKNQSVLAVEAIEGTDSCIKRAGQLCTAGEFMVVKVAKPSQNMCFDVPTVGCLTLETIAAAGGTALVIEAGRTILLRRAQFLASAERFGITVHALAQPVASCAAA